MIPFLVWVAAGACTRAPDESVHSAPDRVADSAIALDRPERPLVPLAGAGALRLERVSLERARLDAPLPTVPVAPAGPIQEPPVPEIVEPPSGAGAQSGGDAQSGADARALKPPIARGAPATAFDGQGAAHRTGHVTLDVRVDENGDVSDALLVESDADSATVRTAIETAMSVRYHPALLGGKPIAVWTRQVYDVRRAAAGR